MKKILLFICVIALLSPLCVFASESPSLNITGELEGYRGDTLTLNIGVDCGANGVSAAEVKIICPSGITLVSESFAVTGGYKSLPPVLSSDAKAIWVNNKNIKEDFCLLTFTVKLEEGVPYGVNSLKAEYTLADTSENKYTSVASADINVLCRHSYGDWRDNGDGRHARVCVNCGDTEYADHVYDKPDSDGNATHSSVCTVCASLKTENHTLSEWKDNADGRHARSCDSCGYNELEAHAFDEWIITLNPTASSKGSRNRQCQKCKRLETSEIPALSEENGYTRTVTKEPTNENEGVEKWESDEYGVFYTAIPPRGSTLKEIMSESLVFVEYEGKQYIKGFTYGSVFESYVTDKNAVLKITAANSKELEPSSAVTTNCIIALLGSDGSVIDEAYTVLVGDITCSGSITTKDYIMIKRCVIGTFTLKGALFLAADINSDGEIETKDYVIEKRVFLGTYVLKQ